MSNREFIDTYDLQRIARYDVSGEYNDDKGYFACDYKLSIGDDNDDFGYWLIKITYKLIMLIWNFEWMFC